MTQYTSWHDSRLCCNLAGYCRQYWHSGLCCQVPSLCGLRPATPHAQPRLTERCLLNDRAKRLTYLEQQRRHVVALTTGVQQLFSTSKAAWQAASCAAYQASALEKVMACSLVQLFLQFAHFAEQEVLRTSFIAQSSLVQQHV